MANKYIFCSFCGCEQSDVNFMIHGDAAYICERCVQVCSDLLLGRRLARYGAAAIRYDESLQPEKIIELPGE